MLSKIYLCPPVMLAYGYNLSSVVRLTDRPDMTIDVYRGRKTKKQQQQQQFYYVYDLFTNKVKVSSSKVAVSAAGIGGPLYLGNNILKKKPVFLLLLSFSSMIRNKYLFTDKSTKSDFSL